MVDLRVVALCDTDGDDARWRHAAHPLPDRRVRQGDQRAGRHLAALRLPAALPRPEGGMPQGEAG